MKMLNSTEAPIPYVDKVKYLGIYIKSRTNCVDPSAALRKFCGCFTNITAVLGYGRDDMLVVHLVKTYCLPIFTARRYASAVLAVVVCPSVCLSVCHKPVLYRNGNT